MAGINLSGAIGMTGKRESIYSDLPSIIQNTGDFLAKQKAEQAETKAKSQLLAQQKQLDENKKYATDYGNVISVNAKGIKYEDNQRGYSEYMTKKYNEAMNVLSDPKTTNSEKEAFKQKMELDAINAREHYLDMDKAMDMLHEDEKGTLDRSKARNVFAGVENVYNKTQTDVSNDLGAPYKQQINVTQAETQVGVMPQLHKMSYEEQRAALQGKTPTQVVSENTYLKNADVSSVLSKMYGDKSIPADAWLKQPTKNGSSLKYEVDEAKKEDQKRQFLYAIEHGTSDRAAAMKQGIEALLYNESRETQMHLTPDERAEFIQKGLQKEALRMYDEWAQAQEAAKTNDPNTNVRTSVTNNYYGNGANPTPTPSSNQKNVVTDSEWEVNPKVDEINTAIRKIENQIKGDNPTPTQKAEYEKRIKGLQNAKNQYKQQNTYTIASRPVIVSLGNSPAELKKADGTPVIGSIVSPFITSQGNLMIEMQSVNDNKTTTSIVPFSDDNAAILLQNAGDNKGKAVKEIEMAREAAAKQKKIYENSLGKGKSVSSQPTAKPKAIVIEGKTIPSGGVPKYSKTTGKLIGYELNGEKFKF